jgi:hypothetical protein
MPIWRSVPSTCRESNIWDTSWMIRVCMWIQPRSKSSSIGYPQSFLGLTNFYHRFLLGFSHITWALSQLTKGGVKDMFVWVVSQQKSFEDWNFFLFSTLFLILPNLQQPFNIETDASDYAIDVSLTQHGNLVTYHSETLSDVV